MEVTELDRRPLVTKAGEGRASVSVAEVSSAKGGGSSAPAPYPYAPSDSLELMKDTCSGVNPAFGNTKALETTGGNFSSATTYSHSGDVAAYLEYAEEVKKSTRKLYCLC